MVVEKAAIGLGQQTVDAFTSRDSNLMYHFREGRHSGCVLMNPRRNVLVCCMLRSTSTEVPTQHEQESMYNDKVYLCDDCRTEQETCLQCKLPQKVVETGPGECCHCCAACEAMTIC